MRNPLACAIALYLLSACTIEHAPVMPTVELTGSAISSDGIAAARVWNELGFRVTGTDFGQPECSRYWYESGDVECAIRITAVVDPNQREVWGTIGQAAIDARMIWIDALVAWTEPDTFAMVLAHEVGHVILDCGHLPSHLDGLMGGGNGGQLSDADRALACERVGACL